MSDFAREPGGAGPEFAVENNCAANSFADSDVEKIAAAAAGADLKLTIRGGIRIVFELKPEPGRFHQLRMQIFANHPGKSFEAITRSLCRLTNPGMAIPTAVDVVCVLTQVADQLGYLTTSPSASSWASRRSPITPSSLTRRSPEFRTGKLDPDETGLRFGGIVGLKPSCECR